MPLDIDSYMASPCLPWSIISPSPSLQKTHTEALPSPPTRNDTTEGGKNHPHGPFATREKTTTQYNQVHDSVKWVGR